MDQKQGEVFEDKQEYIAQLYERFNARDMDRLLAAMDPEVRWANGMDGGHVHDRAGVYAYWTRQWAMVNPHVEPVGIANGPTGEIIVEVHQVIRDLEGNLLADEMVGHLFRIENGLITRFDIRGA